MAPDQLKMMATRNFSNASQIAAALQVRSPESASRSKELFEVINKARETFKSFKFTASIPTAPASTTSEVIAPVTITNVDDVWADFTSTAPTTETTTTTKPAPKSSLFGSTISKKTSTSSPAPSVKPKGKNSALFGKTITTKKNTEASSSYGDVLGRIFMDLEPTKRPVVDNAEAITPAPVDISTSSKVSIPQTSITAFDQTAPIVESKSDLPKPSPPKRPKTEDVVQVKKKTSKSKEKKPEVKRGTGSIAGSSEPGWGMSGYKGKESKTKKRSAEVPEFDYSTAPNVLDNPRSGVKDQGKKKKKERKQPKGMSSFLLNFTND